MRKKLVVGNWKLNGSLAANKARLQQMAKALNGLSTIDIGICLPYVYLFQAQQLLANTSLLWGAQNVSQFVQGAYTSCVSADMVAEFGCSLAILGHSERRFYTDESSKKAVLRIKRASDAGITPIYCIGETLQEHQSGQAKSVIKAQMQPIFNLDAASFLKAKNIGMVIAYEPVWAIGTDQAASPDQAQEMHAFIREQMAEHDPAFAEKMRIIYGGSLNSENAASIFSMPDIDGGLVGRASLDVQAFKSICDTCQTCDRNLNHD